MRDAKRQREAQAVKEEAAADDVFGRVRSSAAAPPQVEEEAAEEVS